MTQTLLTAQGPAFYGVVSVTVPLPLEEVRSRLSRKGLFPDATSLWLEDREVCVHFTEVGPEIQIPQPTVLFDTGHAGGDVAALRFVLSHLHS